MLKKIFGRAKRGMSKQTASPLTLRRTDIEFALVLVNPQPDPQMQWTLRGVVDQAAACGGTVLQILGPLVLVAFSGVADTGDSPQREAFVTHLCSSLRVFVQVVHGRCSALVGAVGSTTRLSYTAIPDDFSQMLQQLTALAPGESTVYV